MEIIHLPAGSRNIKCQYFSGGEGPRPGIVFMHDITGVQPILIATAEKLAAQGFHVLVPDLFSEVGMPRYCLNVVMNRLARTNSDTGNPGLDEVHDLVQNFGKMEAVDGDRLGVVGQCLTGGYALHMALRADVKAPVVFHHTFGMEGSGIPEHCSRQINKKVQGHFAKFDFLCPPSRVNKLQEEMGENLERHDYNLPHAIPYLFEISSEAKMAYDRMLGFFKEQLA